jgi:hypothetical protein
MTQLADAAPVLARVLLAVEWSGEEWTSGPVTSSCPWCHGRPPEACAPYSEDEIPASERGHLEGCELLAALIEAGIREGSRAKHVAASSTGKLKGQVSVAELVEILRTMPQDAPVLSEGCDCYGECRGAEVYHDSDTGEARVLIARLDGGHG